jgi:hypothetical protein
MLSTFMAVFPVFPSRWDAGFTVVDANYSTSEYADLRVKKAHQPVLPLRIRSGLYPGDLSHTANAAIYRKFHWRTDALPTRVCPRLA